MGNEANAATSSEFLRIALSPASHSAQTLASVGASFMFKVDTAAHASLFS